KPEAGGGLTSDGKGGYTGTYSPDGGYDIGIDPDTLPDGVTIKDTTIKKKNPETQEWEPVDKIDGAGEYKVDVTFDGGDDYQDVEGMSTTVTIGKGTHDMDGATITPTGESTGSSGGLKPAANGGYTGTYSPDGGFVLDVDTESLPDGVTPKAPVYKKYTGKGKPEFKADGTPKDPSKWEPVSEISGAGDYIVEVGFDYDEDNYEEIKPVSAVVNIAKADVEIPEDTFKGGTVLSDGSAHKVEVKELPEGVKSVVYEYVDKNGKTVKTSTPPEFTDPGDYVVKAYFEPEDKDNYNEIEPVEITLKISDAVVESISAKLEDGAVFNTANTLDELKTKLTAEIEYNNGKKESVKVEDLEITCDKLRADGKFKSGPVSVTVKYTDELDNEVSTVVNITVQKVKVALPTFKGGLGYTGFAVKPTVDNFNGYDGELMTFVTDKLQSGLNVGTYKAVFALNDYENYEWATATTVSKKVFAVAVYDGEVTLLANEVAVDWSIARAVLTATRKDGALPEFKSESFIGAIADVVTLKYYTDEACTEEVAAEDLAKETTYYVKAELVDTDNFDLDASAAQYTVKSFSYTTPAKELTGFEKVLAVVKANWLWIVIAVVALILLILIIALAVRSSKKKREREERRLAEEKAERERKEEERERKDDERRQREEERRREEREERMAARMAQPQMMMPQMPQMPQMMNQQMPQSQPVAQSAPMGGGSSISEAMFMQMQAEFATMKAEQAALRAEQTAKALTEQQIAQAKTDMQLANILNRLGGDQVAQSGVSMQTLTELVEATVKKVLAVEKPAAQPAAPEGAAASAAPVAAQVPPDAVMTTVTTTKIDTTKKQAQGASAQNAQAAPSGRTVVRNFVAPMPVDDGRVFDVGGFYTPADPITDMGFTDDENKD
ncbi:MAG: hypothetical protein K2O44_05305, partial [Clostridia bacterium]|nr:hypothetical protein [Clostridia bacterium]